MKDPSGTPQWFMCCERAVSMKGTGSLSVLLPNISSFPSKMLQQPEQEYYQSALWSHHSHNSIITANCDSAAGPR